MAKETRQTPTGARELEELAYEQLIEQLEGVVRQLEAGELSLEDSLQAFERGVQLSQAAERRLDAAEHRVEVLLQGDRTQPLPPMEASEAPRAVARPAAAPIVEDDDVPF